MNNTYTNEHGGKQSKLDVRFDLLDPYAMTKLAGVVCVGDEKYPLKNWHKIPVNEHLNHAQYHINAYHAGDTSEDHLAHAFCRLMFANSDKLVI